ncbi:hypothetical protein DH2020_016128 [Rehmannia glutinosa]|uniref:tRNA-uridine aminocarboxypropyltransferase n=1 Tax=Rehmannia glutinosa TaxID=99300 RepID=A0ABR0WW57_REHGL
MRGNLEARIGLQFGNSPQYYPFLNPLRNKIPKLPRIQTLTLQMVTQSGSTRRPTCPSCSKPTRICLCNRLRTPILHNSVTVTILQHTLEKKHPLNSTRIATIGLKNVDVITVSDVNFQARFLIRLLDSSCSVGRDKLVENRHVFDEMPSEDDVVNSESGADGFDLDGQIIERSNSKGCIRRQFCKTLSGNLGFPVDNGEVTDINFTIGKYGAISSFNNCSMAPEKSVEMSFDQLLDSNIAVDCIRKGFVVKKVQTKLSEGKNEYEESEEFEIVVPPGSVLLFPSERSVDVEAVKFEVKNLIVLDGTWAKAKRMYNENPWLRLLAHIRLDVNKLSLYSEVRHQPRAGYLSTIESIVHAMKAVGEDPEGLDGLLDVFESMVGDQRRCKNQRLNKASQN